MMLWWTMVYRLEINESNFVLRNVFFRKRTIYFKDCIMKKMNSITLVQNEKGIEIYRLSDLYTNASKLYDSYVKFYSGNKKKKSSSNEITCNYRILYAGIAFSLVSLFTIIPIMISILETTILGIVLSSLLCALCFIVAIVFFLYFYKWKLVLDVENIRITSPFRKSRMINLKQNYYVIGNTIDFHNKNNYKMVYKIYTNFLNNFQILEK